MSGRKPISDTVETAVLTKSQRRCCLCFGLDKDAEPKRHGQIAHVDRTPSNNNEENLAYLCLPHHDAYDTHSGQSKNYTEGELRTYRDRLYAYLSDLDALNHELANILRKEEVSVKRLVVDPLLSGVQKEVSEAVKGVLDDIRRVQSQSESNTQDPDNLLRMAQGFTVASDWLSAAHHYDLYVRIVPDNWEVHFLRAVAYANTRGCHATSIASVRAYGEAIALVPETIDPNWRARLYTYRGAMFKRLSRLDEALSDLLLAQRWATEPYEVVDNQYNLACVYAMRQEKENMMECLRNLSAAPPYKEAIRHSPYFKNYRNDDDFQDWLE